MSTRGLIPLGGVYWWSEIIKEIEISVPPQFEAMGGAFYAVQDINLAPIVEMSGGGNSLAAFEIAVPPQVEPVPEGRVTVSLEVPPTVQFSGVQRYPVTTEISVPPVVEFAGGERYSAASTVSVPPSFEASGQGFDGGALYYSANLETGVNVQIPSHSIGDIIILWAYNGSNVVEPVKPTPLGTVPDWQYIDHAPAGQGNNNGVTAYYQVTTTGRTSGNWYNATHMCAAVVKYPYATTPIGGHSMDGGISIDIAIVPAYTLSQTDGSSVVLCFFGHQHNLFFNSWDDPPNGYTKRGEVVNYAGGIALLTKDDTTSDGSVTLGTNGTNSYTYYYCAAVEIRNQ